MTDQPPRQKHTMGFGHLRYAFLERAENYIYLATALLLTATAGGLLVVAVIEMTQQIVAGAYDAALLHVLDRALLVLMLAEIIYTVRRIARNRRLEAEPFFIVAIIAAIRRLLVITAESAHQANLDDPAFQALLAELALLAVIILALAWAMRMLPPRNTQDD